MPAPADAVPYPTRIRIRMASMRLLPLLPRLLPSMFVLLVLTVGGQGAAAALPQISDTAVRRLFNSRTDVCFYFGGGPQCPKATVSSTPLTGQARPCKDGHIETFTCQNVELLAWLPRHMLDSATGTDQWGWHDSTTG